MAQFSFLVSDMNTRYEIAYGRNYDKLPRVLQRLTSGPGREALSEKEKMHENESYK